MVHGVVKKRIPRGKKQYCPECQNIFDGDDCVKLAYKECNHVSCGVCIKNAADLGCGQCTTEKAPGFVPDRVPEELSDLEEV